jgi:hypothetical protein
MRDHDLPDVPALRPLDPPPDGAARLRAALDAEDGRDTRWRWAIAAAAVAAFVLVWIALATRPEAPAPSLAIAPPKPRAVLVSDPSIGSGAVPFYWVSSRRDSGITSAPASPPTVARPMVTFRDP